MSFRLFYQGVGGGGVGGWGKGGILHDPKLLTGMELEEETVVYLRRYPSLEGEVGNKRHS